MDSHFRFLNPDQRKVLMEVLTRRQPALLDRIRHSGSVPHSDAEQIMSILNEELADHLGGDWEPTDHGRIVSAVAAQFNTERLRKWP